MHWMKVMTKPSYTPNNNFTVMLVGLQGGGGSVTFSHLFFTLSDHHRGAAQYQPTSHCTCFVPFQWRAGFEARREMKHQDKSNLSYLTTLQRHQPSRKRWSKSTRITAGLDVSVPTHKPDAEFLASNVMTLGSGILGGILML